MEHLVLNEENLRKAYIEDELTQRECAELFDRSQRLIYNYMKRYNIEARPRFNEQHKQRISNKLKGNINGKGVEFTDERKKRISESLKELFKDKTKHPSYGLKRSDETKSKIAKAHLKENLSDEALQAYRESAIKRIERQIADGLPVTPSIGRNEKEIIDKYEKLMNCKFERQFRVAGFFVDGYCKETNIVIEVDEDYHKKRESQDIYREEIIKRELNCDIIRIRD